MRRGNEIAEKVLNDSRVREALRSAIPEIDKLESLDTLKDLRLDSASIYVEGDGTILGYTAGAATQEFYDDPVAALTQAGVIIPAMRQIINTHNSEQPNESKFLEFDYNGLEFYIDLRNPNYEIVEQQPTLTT